MARGARPLGWPARAGRLAALALAGTILASLGAVLAAGGSGRLTAADWAALRFTLVQAALSAALSIGLAIPVARALARRRFAGRGLMVTLLGAPFILPAIVAVFGLLAVFGRGGMVNAGLAAVGLEPVLIYGLHGVVLAHVFFNLPLATRLILQGWAAIPAERFRLAASLGMEAGAVNRHLERPMLRETLPGAALVIFTICTTSFAVALVLGGGPRATTVELAIYQALRFEFDLGKAALLALVQLAVSAAAAALALRLSLPAAFGAGLDRPPRRWDARGMGARARDAAVIALAAAFLLLPLGAIVAKGLPGLVALPASTWAAAGRSVVVALASSALAVCLALAIAIAGRERYGRAVEAVGLSAIAASSLVLGTGLFLLTYPVASPQALALPVTALVNAVMSLPFALRALSPALAAVERDYGRLADSLGLTGLARLRLLLLPRLRRPLGFSAGLAAALSMGDLGVIALFADPARATLPLEMHRLMGAYRMEAAGGAALLLLGLSLAAFWVFDRGGRIDADA